MNAKSPGKRAFFLAAGSGMNFLLAIALMILVIGVQGISNTNVYIDGVNPGSPAARAGWKPGDQLVEVAGAPVDGGQEIANTAREFAGRPMSVVIERRGKLIETIVVPREKPPKDEGPTGVGLEEEVEADIFVTSVTAGKPAAEAGLLPGDRIVSINQREAADRFVISHELRRFAGFDVPLVVERGGERVELEISVPKLKPTGDPLDAVGFSGKVKPRFEHVPASQVIPRGFSEAWQTTGQMLTGLRSLISGDAPLDQVAGPIGMGQIVSEVLDVSPLPRWVTLSQITILLSLNLAVLNLLPLPALDGGRLLFVLVEVLRGGRRVAPEKEGLVHFAGLVLLLGFMFVIAFFDVGRLLSGESFIP